MPTQLKRTVEPEVMIRAMRESLAQELKKKPSSEKLKIEIDMLDRVLKVFSEYREITEQNERARQSKT